MLQPPPTSTLFPYTTLFRSSEFVTGNVLVAREAAGPLDGAVRNSEVGRQIERSIDQRRHSLETPARRKLEEPPGDRKGTRLNSSHPSISYAVFCLKKKNQQL